MGSLRRVGASGVDATQIMVWNEPGPVLNANVIPGSGAALRLMNDQENPAVVIGFGVNGPTAITSDGVGGVALRPGVEPAPDNSQLRLYSPDGTDIIAMQNGITRVFMNGDTVMEWRDALASVHNSAPLAFFSDAGITEEGRITPSANLLVLKATAGALLQIQNEQASPVFSAAAGVNGSVFIRSDGTGECETQSSDGTDRMRVGVNENLIIRNNVSLMRFTDGESQYVNGVPVVFYNGFGTDERWRHTGSLFAGEPDVPADGTLNPSPTYRLRIYNDPVGGPALESFDYTQQYVALAGGGTADVDTEVAHTIRGVPAMGLIHDEGQNECLMRFPTWTGGAAGIILTGTVNGSVYYNPGGGAGQRFCGVHGGGIVFLG